jgi:threonine aldolase
MTTTGVEGAKPLRWIELRSDTFTKPTPAMRKAMADAEVGDDQYGEDPTVNRLERRASEIVGKEAGVYVPSGMMGNLCGVLSQTQRGDEVILDDLATALRPQGMYPRASLVCLENSHNNCGGAVITAAQTKSVADFAHERGMRVHLDGARIFNAAAALGVEAKELVRDVDTVQFCFSKGLAAPVGSILCGDGETVAKARRVRKMLGGAMRQAGVIAAAALVGLEEMRDRLTEDHRNARRLADGLAQIAGVRIDAAKVVTNIVSFEIDPAVMEPGAFQKACAEKGLHISRYLGNSPRLRAVTHVDVTRDDIDAALEITRSVLVSARAFVGAAR